MEFDGLDTALTSGEYIIRMVDSVGCELVDILYLGQVAQVNFRNPEAQLSIYPNPCFDGCHLRLPKSITGSTTLFIRNAMGAVVFESTELLSNVDQIDLFVRAILDDGYYFVELNNEHYHGIGAFIVHENR